MLGINNILFYLEAILLIYLVIVIAAVSVKPFKLRKYVFYL